MDDEKSEPEVLIAENTEPIKLSSIDLEEKDVLKTKVGVRIRDSSDANQKATVRYVGTVASSKKADAIWIGVEWDHCDRGKHNGSVDLPDGTTIQYFTTAGNKASASFLKPNRVDFGVTFVAALQQRYVGLDAPQVAPGNVFSDAYANTSKGNTKPIEFYGELKIRQRQQVGQLEKVALRDAGISSAGLGQEDTEDSSVASLIEGLGQIEMLDLQQNLLSDWEEVGTIIQPFRSLQTLDLSSNKMAHIVPASLPTLGLQSLRTLVINFCGLHWEDVLAFASVLCNLEELYFAGNDASNLLSGGTVPGLNNLKVLDISECQIQDWAQVMALSQLELKSLALSQNNIEEIMLTQGNEAFTELESLALSGNPITSWDSVDQLTALPKLSALRFSNTPLTTALGSSEARIVLLGRLARLDRLNASGVSAKERVESEKAYLRRILIEQGREGNNVPEEVIRQKHPRFEELKRLYADSMVGFGRTPTGGGSLQDSFFSLTLQCVAPSSTSFEPIVKRLPPTLTVMKLKQMCRRLFGIEPTSQQAFFRSEKSEPPTPLDDDNQSLSFFGVFDGCEIFINEIMEADQVSQNAEGNLS